MSKGLWINKNTFIAFSDKTTNSLSAEIATRQRSIDFYSLGMYLPNPDQVLKKMGKDITVYREILTDGHLGGCVSSRKSGVRSLEWEIDRGKAKSRLAKDIQKIMEDLDLDRIISEMLNAPLYGYQPLEILWQKNGQYILPLDITGKPPEWFVFSEENELRFRTRENWNGEPVPEKKFLLARHEATYQNPYGFPELSRCFWPATFKKGGYKFWVKFAEKFGMPFLIGKLPRGLDQKEYDVLADTLEQMVQDAIGVIPDDGSVEMMTIEGKGQVGSIYKDLISECKTEMSIVILGQNLSTEVKGGSYAATESHMAVRQDIIDSDKKIVERALNTFIKWYSEYNYSERTELPKFIMYEEEDVDETLSKRDETLTKTGVKFTKNYFIKAYGFEDEDFEIDTGDKDSMGQKVKGKTTQTNDFALESLNPQTLVPSSLFPDQAAIDAAVGAIHELPLQEQMKGVLKPGLNLIKEGNSYEEILEKLVEIYPDMDDSALEEMLTRAIFVSELWGRLTAAKG